MLTSKLNGKQPEKKETGQENGGENNVEKKKAELSMKKAQLTPMEYRVTQERQTERPYSNKYNKHWEPGNYNCIVCDAQLFRSNTKFESKSGWPAFYNVVDPKRVKLTPDLSHIGANLLLLVAKPDLARTEVSCSNCNAHLGHLFKDGPKPTGLRYCINSSSLSFVPASLSSSPTKADGTLDTRAKSSEPERKKEIINESSNHHPLFPRVSLKKTSSRSSSLPPCSAPASGAAMTISAAAPIATLCLNNQSSSLLSSCQRNNSNNIVRNSCRFPSGTSGASLAAARICFFQQKASDCGASEEPSVLRPLRSSVVSGRPNLPNRFVNSTSSGSLNNNFSHSGSNRSNASILRRRNSTSMFSSSVQVEQVSTPPQMLVLRETSL